VIERGLYINHPHCKFR
jgi:hypothetical protein